MTQRNEADDLLIRVLWETDQYLILQWRHRAKFCPWPIWQAAVIDPPTGMCSGRLYRRQATANHLRLVGKTEQWAPI